MARVAANLEAAPHLLAPELAAEGAIALDPREDGAAIVRAMAGCALRGVAALADGVAVRFDPSLPDGMHAVRATVDRARLAAVARVALDKHPDVSLVLDALDVVVPVCGGELSVGGAVARLALESSVARRE